MSKVILKLSDGTCFTGTSFGYEKNVAGELVFNTTMIGYPEVLTDANFEGQLVVMTYPLIGNYGVPACSSLENGFSAWRIPSLVRSFMFTNHSFHSAGRVVPSTT